MNRRHFLTATAAWAAIPARAASKNATIELRYFRLRNGSQAERTQAFLAKHFLLAAQRAGAGPLGFFGSVVAEQSPFVLVVASYPSMAAFDGASEKLAADLEFRKAFDEYNSMSELSYVRMENSLLRAFDSLPAVEVPPGDAKRPPRLFELRTYESNNVKANKRKIKMFDDAEIAIFRRSGMLPVFFGETIVGRNLPNLTYMLAYDDWSAREKAWRAFGADPEWQKLRGQPGLTDPEIVSNISNALLRPLPFSPIR